MNFHFPYHPLVYNLDLSIYAYQLYSQSLAWPFDPFYEESNHHRNKIMTNVHEWAKIKGDEQWITGNELFGFRGPGVLNGFSDNHYHDPIIYKYDRINPWSSIITNADNTWTEFMTPEEITNQISNAFVCYQKLDNNTNEVRLDPLDHKLTHPKNKGRDTLLIFEGGTGDKGEENQPASHSIMGFVLLRFWPGSDHFDVHITFRGSRSGSAFRAFAQALSYKEAKGNPDWITDLGIHYIDAENGGGHISTVGKVHRGMAKCLESIYPQLFRCLTEVTKLAKKKIPSRIYVTGHSLGGALAQHFVSAMVLGNLYGPDGKGSAMPQELLNWPWKNMKLITYSGPRVGDELWAKTLTNKVLDSDYFSSHFFPYDLKASHPANPEIFSRITNLDGPVGYRVLISTDPITSDKVSGGKHVGKTVYVNEHIFGAPNFESHEPAKIRNHLISTLNDIRIPKSVWEYHDMHKYNPSANKALRGTKDEYKKIAASIEKYHDDKKFHFDFEKYNADLNVFLNLLPE